MAKKIASLTHKCGPGQIWDPAIGQCISIVKGPTRIAKAPVKKISRVGEIYGFKK